MKKTFLLLFTLILVAGCEQTPNEKTAHDHQLLSIIDRQLNVADRLVNDKTYEIAADWSIVSDDEAERAVLLTIDDAPERYSLEMAETLSQLDVQAIFFVNGHFLESEEQRNMLKEIYELGFTIGNHTYSHENLTTLSEEEQKNEIIRVNEMVEEITGEKPKFFRAPFGENTEYSRKLIEKEDMLLMNWTFGYDWEQQYMDAEALSSVTIDSEYLKDGANILMHDREWTNDALESIVNGLSEKGYDFIDPERIH